MKLPRGSLYFLSLFIPITAFAQTYHLVSDIDDTVKISNVRHWADLIYNGLYGDRVFLGMSEFYQAWTQGNSNTVSYLSRSPVFLEKRLKHLLFDHYQFPRGELKLRHLSDGFRSQNFKLSQLQRLLRQADTPLILIGDDGERDPEVFEQFMQDPCVKEKQTLAAAYVHQIVGRPLPAGVVGFVTAFDLALREVEAGRLSTRNALFVGEVILEENRADLLFPSFKNCPKDFSYSLSQTNPLGLGPETEKDPQLVALAVRVKDFIQRVCQIGQRSSKENDFLQEVPEPRL